MIKQIDKNTGMCMSLAARPGNFGCRFFNYLFGELGLNFIYRSTAPTDLADALRGMKALNIRGSALSMPFKELVIPLLDEVDPVAAKIGAVNTIVQTDGKLKGFNTDFLGVKKCLLSQGIAKSSSVILLGSGGMSRAIAYALNDVGLNNTTVVARNDVTRRKLAEDFGFRDSPDVDASGADLLINATPIGMTPDPADIKSFDDKVLSTAVCVMESVADPVETATIQTARSMDKRVITGFDIIVNQAVEQFRLYFGQELPADLAQRAAEHARRT